MKNEPYVTVRHFDGAYHVVATIDGLEHTHQHAFAEKDEAWGLVYEVRAGLERGADLNLALWSSDALA